MYSVIKLDKPSPLKIIFHNYLPLNSNLMHIYSNYSITRYTGYLMYNGVGDTKLFTFFKIFIIHDIFFIISQLKHIMNCNIVHVKRHCSNSTYVRYKIKGMIDGLT